MVEQKISIIQCHSGQYKSVAFATSVRDFHTGFVRSCPAAIKEKTFLAKYGIFFLFDFILVSLCVVSEPLHKRNTSLETQTYVLMHIRKICLF